MASDVVRPAAACRSHITLVQLMKAAAAGDPVGDKADRYCMNSELL